MDPIIVEAQLVTEFKKLEIPVGDVAETLIKDMAKEMVKTQEQMFAQQYLNEWVKDDSAVFNMDAPPAPPPQSPVMRQPPPPPKPKPVTPYQLWAATASC